MQKIWVILGMLLAGCQSLPAERQIDEPRFIDGASAWKLLASKQATLLDVSTPAERQSRLPELQRLVPEDRQISAGTSPWRGVLTPKEKTEFLVQVNRAVPKDKLVLVLCNEGIRADAAAHALEKAGYRVRVIRAGAHGEFSLNVPSTRRIASDGK